MSYSPTVYCASTVTPRAVGATDCAMLAGGSGVAAPSRRIASAASAARVGVEIFDQPRRRVGIEMIDHFLVDDVDLARAR